MNLVYKEAVLGQLVRLLYPPTCLLCDARGAQGQDLCADCQSELPTIAAACSRCGTPCETPQSACSQCVDWGASVSHSLAAFRYETSVRWMIRRLKYQQQLSVARTLGQLMANVLMPVLSARPAQLPDLIVPVPLHRSRIAERGYNQAVELARPIARALRIPLALNVARRIRATDYQSRLDAERRARNLQGAFSVKPCVQGKTIAIIDDVMTTGHTVATLAQALLDAGASRVVVWAVARATLHNEHHRSTPRPTAS